jgi:hypothetical protein
MACKQGISRGEKYVQHIRAFLFDAGRPRKDGKRKWNVLLHIMQKNIHDEKSPYGMPTLWLNQNQAKGKIT